MSNKPLVILGGGGHASVLLDILLSQRRDILAVVSPDAISQRTVFHDIRHLINDEDVLEFDRNEVALVNGIGPTPGGQLRTFLYKKFTGLGYNFGSVISDKAIVSNHAVLSSDAQVLNGAIIQAGAVISENCIINTGAIIEHDCQLGKHNHIGPGATLCGQVSTGNNVYIGASATIIQNINIEQNSVVAAGATVVRDVEEMHTVFGFRSVMKER